MIAIAEQIEDYFSELFGCTDDLLEAVLRSSEQAGLPVVQVTPLQGKLLYLFARILKARRILEIGTLGGYSTIWLARGLAAGGRIVTLELEPLHADVARRNVELAGVQDSVEIVVGPALDSLARMEKDLQPRFDLVFIDAEKEGYPEYLKWAIKLARPGAVILADNIIRGGEVLHPDPKDSRDAGAKKFNTALAAHPLLESVVFQQLTSKGHDGMAIAVVKQDKVNV